MNECEEYDFAGCPRDKACVNTYGGYKWEHIKNTYPRHKNPRYKFHSNLIDPNTHPRYKFHSNLIDSKYLYHFQNWVCSEVHSVSFYIKAHNM